MCLFVRRESREVLPPPRARTQRRTRPEVLLDESGLQVGYRGHKCTRGPVLSLSVPAVSGAVARAFAEGALVKETFGTRPLAVLVLVAGLLLGREQLSFVGSNLIPGW